MNLRKIIARTSSIGPGAANMIIAAATATINNIPLLASVNEQCKQNSITSISASKAFNLAVL